jgi:hypothetical protein
MKSTLSSRSLSPIAALLFGTAAVAQVSPPQSPTVPPPQSPMAKSKADEPKPWRLGPALGTPAWLKVGGSERLRYETLDNQFRFRNATANPPVQGFGNSEDLLNVQTLLRLDAVGDTFGATVEVLDARVYGIEDNGFADATLVNTADLLQGHVDWHLGALGSGKHRLRLGRETVDVGSRRLMARNAYRQTINAFTGVDWMWTGTTDSLRAFWVLPVDRRPNDFESLRDNEWQEDDQDLDLQFAGVAYDHKLDERSVLEAQVFGLDERGVATRRRELLTAAMRWVSTRTKGAFHHEFELSGQVGESKVSTATTGANARVRDHLAGYGLAALGYTADLPWQPSLVASYSYATGDQDPNDNKNERYDTLFGARRWEYGHTGNYGAIARANLNSPELRLVLQPDQAVEVTFAARGFWLASERDAWTASGLRDSSGSSGTHVGVQYEFRLRWDILPRSLQFDCSAVYLAEGSFQDRASREQGRDVTAAYVQMQWTF